MAEEVRQTTRMELALAAVLDTLSEERRLALMQVQRTWSQWLEARCNFIDDPPETGSEAKVELALCRVRTIAERGDELQALQRPAMLAPHDPAIPATR